MNHVKHYKRVSGFTLIEILVVMAIIAMLAVMVAPNLFRQQAGAMRDAALSQISSLETALDSYRLDMNRYPDSLSDLMENESSSASWNGPYLRREVPRDPWGNEYVYESDGRSFNLLSYGADGARGGEDDDADIGL
ncbi:MAG: type II secretion system major pseudopilin GspG [Gammaproteobacteria bacterium]|nr:type II secretion system major pseudopilin GspG [Pseudomonadales bacterium]MCP5347798.1 type II secretion system major pseudopilin GspG [Pseudomonadales bacterium]